MDFDHTHTDEPYLRHRIAVRTMGRWLLHGSLFVLTFFSTTIAGVQWLGLNPFDLQNFMFGIPYSAGLLFILACHEFGHYFASRYYGVDATLPYFLPYPPIPALFQLFINFGTFGAVIRTRSAVPSKQAMFDIGIAGPIAGFIASLLILVYGFTHLPGREFILAIHPDYDFSTNAPSGSNGTSLVFGSTLLFGGLQSLLTHPATQFVPPMSEIYHYPFLCVGWFGLFVTALNLIPMGQFDGGHIIYAMFGEAHKKIARWSCYALIGLSLPSILDALLRSFIGLFRHQEIGQLIPFAQYSWSPWLFWALIALYVVKLYHPPVEDEQPLDGKRMALGWLCIVIFLLSFSINPIVANF